MYFTLEGGLHIGKKVFPEKSFELGITHWLMLWNRAQNEECLIRHSGEFWQTKAQTFLTNQNLILGKVDMYNNMRKIQTAMA